MSETFILFSQPSFIEGLSRNIDLGCTLDEYNESMSPDEADFYAIKNDWKAIGKDILKGIKITEKEINDEKAKQFTLF